MKVPFRFKNLTSEEKKDVYDYLNYFGIVDSPTETENYTIFYLYPSTDYRDDEIIKCLKLTLLLKSYKDKLVKD